LCVATGLALIAVGLAASGGRAPAGSAEAQSIAGWVASHAARGLAEGLVSVGVAAVLLAPLVRTVLSAAWFAARRDFLYFALACTPSAALALAAFGLSPLR